MNWTYNNVIHPELYQIIYININHKYNYIGSCPYETILRKPLLYYNTIILDKINYPINCGLLHKNIEENIDINTQLDTNWKNVLNFEYYSYIRKRYIKDYFRLITH